MKEESLHVFIVPDGNRRWAKDRGLLPQEGHKQGYETLRSILKEVWSLGVAHFTFWGLSMDNFRNRSPKEIMAIFHLFEKALDELLISPELEKEKVCVRIIGRLKEGSNDRQKEKVAKLEKKTIGYKRRNFTLLFGYSGNEELADAVNQFRHRDPYPTTGAVNWDIIRSYLWTSFLPDVDIFIRTGFEPHLSAAALCMQMANAHLYFPECYWPDFSTKELTEIINDFKQRERRSGA